VLCEGRSGRRCVVRVLIVSCMGWMGGSGRYGGDDHTSVDMSVETGSSDSAENEGPPWVAASAEGGAALVEEDDGAGARPGGPTNTHTHKTGAWSKPF